MKLLHIDSSILGDASASRQLSAELVQAWRQNEDGLDVTYRDLAADAVAHFSALTLAAGSTRRSCAMPRWSMKSRWVKKCWKSSSPPTSW